MEDRQDSAKNYETNEPDESYEIGKNGKMIKIEKRTDDPVYFVENDESDESTEIGENRELIKTENRTLEYRDGTIENNEPDESTDMGEEEEQINLYVRLNQLLKMGNK